MRLLRRGRVRLLRRGLVGLLRRRRCDRTLRRSLLLLRRSLLLLRRSLMRPWSLLRRRSLLLLLRGLLHRWPRHWQLRRQGRLVLHISRASWRVIRPHHHVGSKVLGNARPPRRVCAHNWLQHVVQMHRWHPPDSGLKRDFTVKL